MVDKKTGAIDRIAIDHIVKLRDWLVVERLRLFRLKRAIDAYAQTVDGAVTEFSVLLFLCPISPPPVDSQLLSASRSDGPLARPRSCVAKPIRSEMPNSDSLVARGGERSGIAGANPARVGDTPISSNESGLGVTFLFLLEAPVLTAFNPKKRCPFQFVPVIALATCERLR